MAGASTGINQRIPKVIVSDKSPPGPHPLRPARPLSNAGKCFSVPRRKAERASLSAELPKGPKPGPHPCLTQIACPIVFTVFTGSAKKFSVLLTER